jgi:DNA-binding MarR family transcriptional regulator
MQVKSGKGRRHFDEDREKTLATAGERVSRAIIELRRNPQNRAIQRRIYVVGDYELTPVQVDILETVVDRPMTSMNELAQALGVVASTVSRTIVPLIDLGLIERRNDAGDRRLIVLAPTTAGLKQSRRIRESRSSTMRAVLGRFPPERVGMLADLLEEYLSAVTAEGIAQSDAMLDE